MSNIEQISIKRKPTKTGFDYFKKTDKKWIKIEESEYLEIQTALHKEFPWFDEIKMFDTIEVKP